MKEKIDSEKIIRHIKYTRHWLDKANDDITEKRFSAGGMILNLARAEITAALEEALMLKSRVAAKLPVRRPSVKWGVASSVSLLASGFIIAVLVIHFSSNPIPRPGVVTPAPTAAVQEAAPQAEQVAEEVTEPAVVEKAAPAPAKVAAPRRVVRAPAPAPEPVVVVQPPAPVVEPAPRRTIKQTEIIDLYRTAKEALAE